VTGPGWLPIAVLVAAAVAAAWPSGRARRRLRLHRSRAGRRHSAISVPRLPAWRDLVADRSPRRLIAMATTAAGGLGWIAGGPVAALVGGVYAALAARAATRAASSRRHAATRAARLDDLSALSADLRAGLPPAGAAEAHADVLGAGLVADPATTEPTRPPLTGRRSSTGLRPTASERGSGDRILDLIGAVWRLAERTGAPAADLIERIERDARAADRARASAAAQAAGAQATALLLAALPLGGIAVGYAIGADPLRVLLHTPLGAACAAGAVLLQSGGLLWADRLTNGAVR
jgi:tight adherence protein B